MIAAGAAGSLIASLFIESPMKIIAFDNFKPGVTLDDLRPYLRDEVANVWRLWKAGIGEVDAFATALARTSA